MKKLIPALLGIIMISAGCGGNEKQPAQQDTPSTDTLQEKQQPANVEKEEAAGKLVLDNGSKWKANAATTGGIQKMLRIVNEYINKGDTDGKKLSDSLDKEFTTILQKCTMSGMAHEQLHNFLLPFKEKIGKLKETKDTASVMEIRSYLNNYYNYFE
jgi:PBP1b-binding outer membrane lipoprotein LpoB